jgi:ClpP class serine protease
MMAHKLLRLTQKLYQTPHLISASSFANIESYLNSRNASLMPMIPEEPCEEDCEPTYASSDEGLDDLRAVGVIDIKGTLTNEPSGWEALCGGCSYKQIMEEAEDLIEYGATIIILNIDSGGGEAFGAFECANDLRAICDDSGVYLITYVQGCAASAAYAIACIADEVICNPYGETGSIGVLISLCDQSKHLEMEGYRPVFVTAGKSKIPYAEDGSFRKEFLDDLQNKVDYLYGEFVSHVVNYTEMSDREVKATEAKTFLAKDALEIGLINGIMTNKEFVKYVVDKQKGNM